MTLQAPEAFGGEFIAGKSDTVTSSVPWRRAVITGHPLIPSRPNVIGTDRHRQLCGPRFPTLD